MGLGNLYRNLLKPVCLCLAVWLAVQTAACGGGGTVRDYLSRGKEYMRQGDYESAQDEFTRAIEEYPDDFAPYLGRAWLRFDLGNLNGALADFNQAVKLNPESPLALRGRSRVFEKLGRTNEAIEDLKRALVLDPGDLESSDRLDRLKAGAGK